MESFSLKPIAYTGEELEYSFEHSMYAIEDNTIKDLSEIDLVVFNTKPESWLRFNIKLEPGTILNTENTSFMKNKDEALKIYFSNNARHLFNNYNSFNLFLSYKIRNFFSAYSSEVAYIKKQKKILNDFVNTPVDDKKLRKKTYKDDFKKESSRVEEMFLNAIKNNNRMGYVSKKPIYKIFPIITTELLKEKNDFILKDKLLNFLDDLNELEHISLSFVGNFYLVDDIYYPCYDFYKDNKRIIINHPLYFNGE